MQFEIGIPDQEVADLLRFTGAETVEAAVVAGVVEVSRGKRLAALAGHAGQGELLDTVESLQASRRGRQWP